jgi:hypothetical protein
MASWKMKLTKVWRQELNQRNKDIFVQTWISSRMMAQQEKITHHHPIN